MKIKFAKVIHVCIVVIVLAIVAIGFMSCGEKSHLSEIVITPSTPGMAIGSTLQLTGSGVLSNGVTFLESYLTWTSSNPDIAGVDSTGLVTAGATTGEITITATETDSHTNVSGQTIVTVCTVSSIALSPANPSMAVNTTYQFTATATLSPLSSGVTPTQIVTSYMTWTTLDSTIATVDSTGIVTAGSVTGSTLIQATASTSIDPAQIIPVQTLTLTVTDTALTSISATATDGVTTSVTANSTLQLIATGTYEDATTAVITLSMTWSSSDTSIATVDAATGLVTGVSAGTATITATDPITAVAGTIDITVN